jgi:hypothetical protein
MSESSKKSKKRHNKMDESEDKIEEFEKSNKQKKSSQNSKKAECSVQTHRISATNSITSGIPANTFDYPLFIDYTKNHNKTFIQLTFTQGGVDTQPLTVTIKTRDNHGFPNQIVEDLPLTRTRIFQVENFQELTIRNPNNLLISIQVYIEKTFCICCNENKDCQDCKEGKDVNESDPCFTATHRVSNTQSIDLQAVGTEPLFIDNTKNHNKTFIQIQNVNSFTYNAIITTRDKKDGSSRQIVAEIPRGPSSVQPPTRIFQVEDFESLSFDDPDASPKIYIEKTFCICCEDKKDC